MASVVVKRESVAVTRSLAVTVVTLALGLPPQPETSLTASRGEDWVTPVKEAAASFMEPVAPVMDI